MGGQVGVQAGGQGGGQVGGQGGGQTYSYTYVPGAGDDEESWAEGLTPALFWKHQQVSISPESTQQRGIVSFKKPSTKP